MAWPTEDIAEKRIYKSTHNFSFSDPNDLEKSRILIRAKIG